MPALACERHPMLVATEPTGDGVDFGEDCQQVGLIERLLRTSPVITLEAFTMPQESVIFAMPRNRMAAE
jgi:hypothetical protein